MCLPDAPCYDDDFHYMLGDQTQPQLGSEEAGRFFQPLDYEKE